MNRLQKKCAVASSIFHGSLVAVFLFGAALMPAPPESNFKPITFYNPNQVTAALSQGGDPDAKAAVTPPTPPAAPQVKETLPPKAQPETPKPEPVKPPEPVKQPDPIKVEPIKTVHPVHREAPKVTEPKITKTNPRLDPDDLKPVTPKTKTPHKIDIDPRAQVVTRKGDDKAKAEREAAEAANAEARAKAKRAARDFAMAMKNISGKLSTATTIVEPGPGGGGEVSVNYRDLIASKYYNAWVSPAGLDDDTPIVTATITIAKSGEVTNARIVKRSGNSLMDRSIQHVLETVTFIEPFPVSYHEQEMTITVNFNVQAKRQLG